MCCLAVAVAIRTSPRIEAEFVLNVRDEKKQFIYRHQPHKHRKINPSGSFQDARTAAAHQNTNHVPNAIPPQEAAGTGNADRPETQASGAAARLLIGVPHQLKHLNNNAERCVKERRRPHRTSEISLSFPRRDGTRRYHGRMATTDSSGLKPAIMQCRSPGGGEKENNRGLHRDKAADKKS